jgi:hypothetical protein
MDGKRKGEFSGRRTSAIGLGGRSSAQNLYSAKVKILFYLN